MIAPPKCQPYLSKNTFLSESKLLKKCIFGKIVGVVTLFLGWCVDE